MDMPIEKYVVKDITNERNYVQTTSGYHALNNQLFTQDIDLAHLWNSVPAAKGFITSIMNIMNHPNYAQSKVTPNLTYSLIVVPITVTRKE
jgi:hypothetical protein